VGQCQGGRQFFTFTVVAAVHFLVAHSCSLAMLSLLWLQVWQLKVLDSSSCISGFVVNAVIAVAASLAVGGGCCGHCCGCLPIAAVGGGCGACPLQPLDIWKFGHWLLSHQNQHQNISNQKVLSYKNTSSLNS
jgi:hypothetical protein